MFPTRLHDQSSSSSRLLTTLNQEIEGLFSASFIIGLLEVFGVSRNLRLGLTIDSVLTKEQLAPGCRRGLFTVRIVVTCSH